MARRTADRGREAREHAVDRLRAASSPGSQTTRASQGDPPRLRQRALHSGRWRRGLRRARCFGRAAYQASTRSKSFMAASIFSSVARGGSQGVEPSVRSPKSMIVRAARMRVLAGKPSPIAATNRSKVSIVCVSLMLKSSPDPYVRARPRATVCERPSTKAALLAGIGWLRIPESISRKRSTQGDTKSRCRALAREAHELLAAITTQART